jgi:hypothetical protein
MSGPRAVFVYFVTTLRLKVKKCVQIVGVLFELNYGFKVSKP